MSSVDLLLGLAHSGRLEDLRRQLREKPEVANQSDSIGTPVIIALSRFGDAPTLKLLVDAGANPNEVDSTGETPLISCLYGARQGRDTKDALRCLLELGANPNQFAYLGQTALHVAARFRLAEYLSLLIDYGGDVALRTRDFGPESVLEVARATRSEKTIRAALGDK